MSNQPPFPRFNCLFLAICLLCPLLKVNAQGFTCFSPNEAHPEVQMCGVNAPLSDYIPQADDPVKIIRLAFHVMQRELPFPRSNFDQDSAAHVAYLQAVFNRVNDLYSNCNVMWCDTGYVNGTNYIRDSRIRFELIGIDYIQNNSGHTNGNGDNSQYCHNTFSPACSDGILDVYFCRTPGTISGVGNKSIVLYNIYDDYLQSGGNAWSHGNLLGHEIGHILSLVHSWEPLEKSRLLDICQIPNERSTYCSPQADSLCTNNMMAYSALNDFISPLQMADMHESLINSGASRLLKTVKDDAQNILISQTTHWDKPRIVYGDVTVQHPATLTISCKTIMSPNTRIIVKRGARLIVDGGHIATKEVSAKDCYVSGIKRRWLGVEVWGNTFKPKNDSMLMENFPLSPTDPGVVILKNKAILEDAQVGIFAQQRGYPWASQLEHFGGLVSATNSRFRNCRKGVEYISAYPIHVPSTFTNCDFRESNQLVSTDNTIFEQEPTITVKQYEGITSWQVSGIQISDDCKFRHLSNGVVVGDATVNITASTFQSDKYGVVLGTSAPSPLQISTIGGPSGLGLGNTFLKCNTGITARPYGRINVYDNVFQNSITGVQVEGPSIYFIQENEFLKTPDSMLLQTAIALFNTSFSGGNLISCNRDSSSTNNALIFDGVFVGGNNDGTSIIGNRFDCFYDVRLEQLTTQGSVPVTYKASLPDQGGFGSPFYNEFTDTTGGANHRAEIHTPPPSFGQTAFFTYYPPTFDCQSILIPKNPYIGDCQILGAKYYFENDPQGSTSAFPCSFGPIDGVSGPEPCTYPSCLEWYYTRINLLDGLLVPGRNPALLAAVQSAPNEAGTIGSLISASPYLSEDILAAVSTSNMSATNKRSVLAANLPLSPYIWELALGTLDQTSVDSLLAWQQVNTVSLRDEAIQDRKALNNQKMTLLHQYTDSLYTAGNPTAAASLWQNDPEPYSREALVGLKLHTGDFTAAAQLLSAYPTVDAEDARFKFIQTLHLSLLTNGLEWKPAAQDSVTLFDVASSYSRQAGYAKTLVWVLYDTILPTLIPLPEEPEERSYAAGTTYLKPQQRVFTVYPNPAADVLTVQLHAFRLDTHPRLRLYNALGELLIEVAATEALTRLNVASLPPGIHHLVCMTDSGPVAAQNIVITHR